MDEEKISKTPKKTRGFQVGHPNYLDGHTEGAKKKISDGIKKAWTDGKFSRKFSEEHRKKLSKAHNGKNNPFYGKCHSEETKRKIGKANTGRKFSKETRKKMSENSACYWKDKQLPKETREKMSKSRTGKKLTKEHIKNILHRRPISGLEEKVLKVIQKHSLPYKFVGNGKFLIEKKNPDFVNTNGEKVAVEVYCRRHKDYFRGGCDGWRKNRSELFAEYGWEIIFIEDWQTNKEETILGLLK